MSIVTHVIPQTFAEGQILNIVTNPTIPQAQDIIVAQTGAQPQLIPTTQVTLATVQVEPKHEPGLEREKQSIYKHPLFPLMALMFERCEQASNSSDFPSQESFEQDIRAFIAHQEKEKKSFFSNDEELDNLMIKAIQVLRIHLLELEKVNELCKDFCTRYTNCLKGKLQSENLLRTESDYDQSMFDEPPKESPTTPVQTTVSTGGVILQQPFVSSVPAVPTLGPGQIISGGTVYQMVQTPQGLVAQPLQGKLGPNRSYGQTVQTLIRQLLQELSDLGLHYLQKKIQQSLTSLATTVIHGSTPLSQIGLTPAPTMVSTPSVSSVVNSIGSISSGFDSDDDDNGKKKNKRGVLPKSATQIMKSWLFQHIVHPYPTEDEKRLIAGQTNLTLLQVNNWFINARRRILQPMLDAGNPEQTKAKKAKPQNKPPQRFWPFSEKSDPGSVTKSDPTSSSTTSSPSPSTPTTIASLPQAIVLPPGAFVTPEGQILNLQSANVAAMLNQVKQTSPSPPLTDKESSDNNNNSHNTDNDMSETDDLT